MSDDFTAILSRVPTPPSVPRPRSILLEPSSPYSKSRRSPSDSSARARQSVSSIGSCSTVQTPSAAPTKSILARHDSGISMATTTKSSRRKKGRSPPSVKFVDAPTVHYGEDVVYHNVPPRSPPSQARQPARWFNRWWNRPSTPPRPTISGPYHISYGASLVDVHTRSPGPAPGRLKQLWNRLTSMLS